MLRIIVSFCLGTLLITGKPAKADVSNSRLPEVSGYTLDGNRRSLPDDLEAPETLLVVSLESPSADDVSSWQSRANTMGRNIPVLFMVLLDDRGPRARAFAAGRLRGKVQDPAHRELILAVFSDVDAFYRSTGIARHPAKTAFLVSEDGTILGRSHSSAPPETTTGLAASVSRQQERGVSSESLAGSAPAKGIVAEAPAPEPSATDKPASSIGLALATSAPNAALDSNTERPVLPEIEGYTLAGDRISIPADVSSVRMRLYFLGHGSSASAVRQQVEAIASSRGTEDDWLALVFMGKASRLSKAFAAGSLRREIASVTLRKHVVPVFTDIAELENGLGFDLLALDLPICVEASGSLCASIPAD